MTIIASTLHVSISKTFAEYLTRYAFTRFSACNIEKLGIGSGNEATFTGVHMAQKPPHRQSNGKTVYPATLTTTREPQPTTLVL